jgi:hypothetical protein
MKTKWDEQARVHESVDVSELTTKSQRQELACPSIFLNCSPIVTAGDNVPFSDFLTQTTLARSANRLLKN